MPKFLQTLRRFRHRQLTVGARLGVELVGIAHQFFLQILRLKAWQTRTRVAFADTGMTFPPLASEQLTAYLTVTDVGFRAVTMDGGCVAPAYADKETHLRYSLQPDSTDIH